RCPVGCESKIDTLTNEVRAQERALNQVAYFQTFTLTPTQQDPSHGLWVERVLPNYADVLLVHVVVDHDNSAVLLPAPTQAQPPNSGFVANRIVFSSNCRNLGKAPVLAKVNVTLGLLRQETAGKNAFGIRVAVDGCDPVSGQIPVEVTVLSKV
ncbi:MAG: hypothetical protein WAN19_01655, partial [Candidatus Sulfotelmatobacter sp.]